MLCCPIQMASKLFLTASSGDLDKLTGLGIGGDDIAEILYDIILKG